MIGDPIIVVYLLFAPRLHQLARRHQFVTPGDWLTHRFGSPALTLLANLLLLAAIGDYLLAQLMAMGHITAGLSGGAVPYWVGLVLLTLVVLVYETVGGMRAIAWTDSLSGLMLVVGLTDLLVAASPTPTHFATVTQSCRRLTRPAPIGRSRRRGRVRFGQQTETKPRIHRGRHSFPLM